MAELCPACGLCCNGVIFADLAIQPGAEAARLKSLGLAVSRAASPRLPQPCAAFDGCRCRIYPDRPRYCRQFECALLQSVKAGLTESAAALSIIRTARRRAAKVQRLLRALGETEHHLPLSKRIKRMNQRLQSAKLDPATAATYADLTLASHDLNLLLANAFYPGNTAGRTKPGARPGTWAKVATMLALCLAATAVQADQVEMQNGDHYAGKIVSMSTNTVVLQSDVLGTVRLPRATVASIKLESAKPAASPVLPSPSQTQVPPASAAKAAAPKASSMFSGLDTNSFLVQQVQKQFLSDAGGEANAKFNELLTGLMSGKLDVQDIRAQAKTAAEQLRTLQRESGEETSLATGTYLAILDHFLQETEPATGTTNKAERAPAAKAPLGSKDE